MCLAVGVHENSSIESMLHRLTEWDRFFLGDWGSGVQISPLRPINQIVIRELHPHVFLWGSRVKRLKTAPRGSPWTRVRRRPFLVPHYYGCTRWSRGYA